MQQLFCLQAERKAARKYAKQIDSKYGLTPEDERPGRKKKGKDEEQPEEDDFFKQLDRHKTASEEAPRAHGKKAKDESDVSGESDDSEGDSDDSEAQAKRKKAAKKKKAEKQRSGASSSGAPVRYGLGPLPPATPPPAVPGDKKGKKAADKGAEKKKDHGKDKKKGKDSVKVEASGARRAAPVSSLGWGGI